MTHTMEHRGPDDSGHFVDESISLGHRRLSILDLSAEGHQPMFDSDQEIVIVYNGEIYNFFDLEEELKSKGYKFRSKTDTEMILYAYKEWGPECLNHFIGMFAFVIYEPKA